MINLHTLKNQFLTNNQSVADFSSHNNPSQNQIIFFRTVSLNNIFKNLEGFGEETKNFPEISDFASDSADNIKFEPLLNRNLLKTSLICLQKLDLLLTENLKEDAVLFDLKQLIISELEIIKKNIADTNNQIDKVPYILTKNPPLPTERKMSSKPKVSVISLSFNLANMVEETVRSIGNQECDSFEHIVIDGASTDGSIELLKKYPHIILVSEKDKGTADAFWKGIRMARGDYVLQSVVSDGYATVHWIRKCMEVLDANKDVSLVWGFSCSMNNDSKLVEISHPQFHYSKAPEKGEMFEYWLKTYCHFPEVNLCVRKSVLIGCFPSVEDCKKDILDWLEFSYRFNSSGYIAVQIPTLANFYHTNHGNQLGKKIDKSGQWKRMREDYEKKVKSYKWKLMLGWKKHNFIDSNGKVLPITFDKNGFVKEYLADRIKYGINKIVKYFK